MLKKMMVLGLFVLNIDLLATSDIKTPPTFSYDSISKQLSQKTIKALAQDSRGFLWIGTEYGLNCYDGYRLESFHKNGNGNLWLGGNYINFLHFDNKTGLWIGDDGPSLITATEKKRIQLPPETGLDPTHSSPLTAMASRGQGGLFLGTVRGLFFYDPWKNQAEEIPASTTLNRPGIRCLTAGPSGNLWIGLQSGVGVKQPGKSSFRHLEFTKHLGRISTLTELDDEVVLIGTEGKGLWLAKDQRIFKLALGGGFSQDPFIWDVIEVFKQCFLIATAKGLFFAQIDLEQGTVIRSDLVLYNSTYALMKDHAGVIWAGSEVGLFRTNKAGLLATIPLDQVNSNLRYSSVRSFCFLSPTELMVGTDSGQPLIYNFSDGSLSLLSSRFPQLAPLDTKKFIRAMVVDSNGDLWVGSGSGLTYVKNPFEGQTRMTRILPDLVIRVLKELPGHRLLVGSEGRGLFLVDLRDAQKRPIKIERTPISNPFINSITVDKSGSLILGTSRGIDFIDLEQQGSASTMFLQDPEDNETNFVLCTWLSPEGVLWAGTSNGLLKIEKKNIKGHWTTQNRLPSNFIAGLSGDSLGNLWGSTINGVFKMNLETEQPESFSPEINEIGEYKVGAVVAGPDNRVVFGGIGGFTIANSNMADLNAIPPQTHITDLLVVNGRAGNNESGLVDSETPPSRKLVLDAYQDPVIHFTGIHTANPGKNRFRYRLRGHETGWTEVDAGSRVARYTQLPWGRYVFEVYAANPHGVWDSEGDRALVIKLPPIWWQTPAKIGYALLFGLICLAVARFFRRHYREKERKKSVAIHNSKLQELGKFATAITHDLNRVLASIAGFTSLALQDSPARTRGRHYLKKIDAAWRNGSHLVAQIGLFGKRKTETEEKSDLVVLLKESLDMVEVACPKSMSFKLKSRVTEAWVLGSRTELMQVFSNLLHNGIDACKNKEGHIDIHLEKTHRHHHPAYAISFQDNGQGMEAEVVENVFKPFFTTKKEKGLGLGLAVVKGVIDALEGEIKIRSEPGQGANISILLPQTEPAGETSKIEHTKPIGLKRVMWVDEDRNSLKLGISTLRTLGHEAVGFHNSSEAQAYFSKNPRTFDLIVIDQQPLGEETMKTIQCLAETNPKLRIVCFSLSTQKETEKSMPGHKVTHLKKPLYASDVNQVLKAP